MALNPALLQQGLLDCFNGMADSSSGDEDFIKGMCSELESYFNMGMSTNLASGAQQPLSTQASVGEAILRPVVLAMANMTEGGDAALANALMGTCSAMVAAGSAGTAAQAAFAASSQTIGPQLNSLFQQMLNAPAGGDEMFAAQFAVIVNTAALAGAIV